MHCGVCGGHSVGSRTELFESVEAHEQEGAGSSEPAPLLPPLLQTFYFSMIILRDSVKPGAAMR